MSGDIKKKDSEELIKEDSHKILHKEIEDKEHKEKNYVNFNAMVFKNKTSGQYFMSIPKRQVKGIGDKLSLLPKLVPIRIKKWW